jgi:RNA polymerase sigma factor (sigma-70 family)
MLRQRISRDALAQPFAASILSKPSGKSPAESKKTLSDFPGSGCLMGEMQAQSDAQLLRAYAERRDEAAFRELVARYTDLVYSAAFRQVESAATAGDIAQSVFTALARKPEVLVRGRDASTPLNLAGWLHRATRFAALNHRRATRRRLTHERQAMEQLLTNSDPAAGWEQIRPVLDEALDSLGDEDREALLLRYFKNQDFRAVGLALGVSDDTAQKRVSRAVERLREYFSQRNVTIGASGLAVVISANAVQAAPIGLAATISAAAILAGTAVQTSTVIAAAKTIAMTTLQKTIVTATLAVVAGAGIYEAHQAAQLREQNQTLQQQQAPLAEQIQQLQNERDKATNIISWLKQELAKNESNNAELLKLRGEVEVVRNQLADAKRASRPVEQPPLATGQAYLKRSYEHGAKHEFEAELDDLNHAIELDPTLAQAYRERAGLYSRLPEDRGGEKQAIADYSYFLKLKPNDVGSLLMRADSYEKSREYDKSIADYTAVIESINQNTADFSNVYMGNNTDKSYWIASAYTMRAQIYKVDKHDYSNAIADYTATIQLNPISPNSYRSRGECYEAIGETAKAQQDFAIEPKRSF